MANDTTVYTTFPEAHTDERVRYFDGQFLTSQDFVDEQRYHVDRLRRALDHLTVSGVAEGLEVAPSGPWKLKLSAGAAVDARGRLLVVLAARDGVDVPKDIPGGSLDVALYYAEVESRLHGGTSDEDGTRGATRMRELPALEFYATGQTPEHPDGVPLARLQVAGDGALTLDSPNPPIRRATGLRLPSVGGPAPVLRAGFARPQLLQLGGDLWIAGKLGVGTENPEAELDVRGTLRLGHLSQRTQSFRVDGDEATFYPIAFKDLDWASGACTLELVRPNAQVDAASAGALLARVRWHAADGQGNELLDVDVFQTRRFIAHARASKSERLLVVWLRGNRSYAWRASQRLELSDGAAAGKTLAGEKFDPRQTIDPAYDRDRFRLGPAVERDTITGDLAYTGKLDRLDTLEQSAAAVRVHDLYLGHSTRRGSPGRALVDNKDSLVLNFAADWPLTVINSKARINGDLAVDGETTLTKGVAGDVKLNSGGLTVSKGGSFGDGLKVTDEAEHVTLVRPKTTSGGVKMFLELIQDDGANVPDTFPAIRFHHHSKFWHRLEARGDGLHVRHGDLTSDNYKNFFAAGITANGDLTAAGALTVAKAATISGNVETDGALTVAKASVFNDGVNIRREKDHLLLSRSASETTGGARIFLELRQDDPKNPPKVPETGPSIRFHHGNRFHHRIEGRADGIHIRDGSVDNNNYKDLFAGNIKALGFDVVTAPAERLRIVRGIVNDAGGNVEGDGFTIEKSGKLWKVSFTPAFAHPPTVVVTQQYPDSGDTSKYGSSRDNAVIVRCEAGAVWILTGDGNGDATFRRFHFIAIGP